MPTGLGLWPSRWTVWWCIWNILRGIYKVGGFIAYLHRQCIVFTVELLHLLYVCTVGLVLLLIVKYIVIRIGSWALQLNIVWG